MQPRAEPPQAEPPRAEPPQAEPYTVRLSDPGEIAAGLPHLLGFRPEESVVLISLTGPSGGRVGLTVRADIPPAAHVPELARALTRSIRTDRPAAVLVAVVSESPDEPLLGRARPAGAPSSAEVDLPHRRLVRRMLSTLTAAGIPVRDALLVRGGRWWSYECTRRCCSPEAGTPLPGGVTELEVASVAAGTVVVGRREDLADRIAPLGGRTWAATSAALVRAAGKRAVLAEERGRPALVEEATAQLVEAVAACRPGEGAERLPDDVVARVLWGLFDPLVRDAGVDLLLGADAHAAEALWVECTRRAPSPLDVAPATLLAISAWLRGDGAMANVALERALDSDPEYSLARMLQAALASCLPPEELRALLRESLGVDGPDRPAG